MLIKNKIFFILGIILILSGISLITYNQLRTPDYLSYSESDFTEQLPSKKRIEVEADESEIIIEEIIEPVQTVKPDIEEPIVIEEKVEEVIIAPEVETEKAEKVKTNEAPIKKTQKFYIISGVFSVEEYAKIHVENLKKEGYNDALIIGKVNGLFNVSFGKYTTRDEADKILNEIKETFQASAWILYI